MSHFSVSHRESKLALPLTFCSIWALSGLVGAIFFSLLIQVLMPSGNTFTDTSRNNFYQFSGKNPLAFSPIKLTHKINITMTIKQY